MLDWLDDERQRQVDAIWRDWNGVHLSTAPAERSRAERGMVLAYREAGLPPPERIVWRESPLAGARTAAAVLTSAGQERVDLLTGASRVLLRHTLVDPPDPTWPWDSRVSRISRVAWEDLAELIDSWPLTPTGGPRPRPHDDIADELAARLGGSRWEALEWGRFFGQPAALDLGRCDLLRRVAGVGGFEQLQGFVEVARSAGWCWPFERTVVQRDHCGNLWRAEVPGDEPLVMIEVRNATLEADGSRRTFWLRVPPQVLTALEGIAWTFDLPPERYQPRVQT